MPVLRSVTFACVAIPEPSVVELRELEGRSEAEILGEFGQPSERSAFTMAERCDEYAIELYNTYPHAVEGRWTVLETLHFRDGVNF